MFPFPLPPPANNAQIMIYFHEMGESISEFFPRLPVGRLSSKQEALSLRPAELEPLLQEKTHLLKQASQASRLQPKKRIKRRCVHVSASQIPPECGCAQTNRVPGPGLRRPPGACWFGGSETQPVGEEEGSLHTWGLWVQKCPPPSHPPPPLVVISVLASQGSEQSPGPRKRAGPPRGLSTDPCWARAAVHAGPAGRAWL